MALAPDLSHEFWRLQLLDELRHKLVAFEYEPRLDPSGMRREALHGLIAHFEQIEADDLHRRRSWVTQWE